MDRRRRRRHDQLHSTADRFVIPSLTSGDRCGTATINAPVNLRYVGADGSMGDPQADCDVVRYDFSLFPGLGGTPGKGGTTVIAAHVDYHPHYEAVFWNVRNLNQGDEVDYYTADGKKSPTRWTGRNEVAGRSQLTASSPAAPAIRC